MDLVHNHKKPNNAGGGMHNAHEPFVIFGKEE